MPRNVRFERALMRAIRAYTRKHGRGPHVLDIGSGTGLLAMMAARGGARKVTTVEMVPAICVVAEQIIERNGYSDVVNVINIRSDQLTPYALYARTPRTPLRYYRAISAYTDGADVAPLRIALPPVASRQTSASRSSSTITSSGMASYRACPTRACGCSRPTR